MKIENLAANPKIKGKFFIYFFDSAIFLCVDIFDIMLWFASAMTRIYMVIMFFSKKKEAAPPPAEQPPQKCII